MVLLDKKIPVLLQVRTRDGTEEKVYLFHENGVFRVVEHLSTDQIDVRRSASISLFIEDENKEEQGTQLDRLLEFRHVKEITEAERFVIYEEHDLWTLCDSQIAQYLWEDRPSKWRVVLGCSPNEKNYECPVKESHFRNRLYMDIWSWNEIVCAAKFIHVVGQSSHFERPYEYYTKVAPTARRVLEGPTDKSGGTAIL
jgi:hypothetical protein